MALCVGAGGAIARVERASLPLVRRSALAKPAGELEVSPLSIGEAAAWQRVVGAFSSS